MSKIVGSGNVGTIKRYSFGRILAFLLVFAMLAAIISPSLKGGTVHATDTSVDISAATATADLQAALSDPSCDVITLTGASTLQLTAALDVPVGRTVTIQAASDVSLYSYWDSSSYATKTATGTRHISVIDDGPTATTTSITFRNVILEGNGYDNSALPWSERWPFSPKGGGIDFDSDYGSTLILDGAVIQGCDWETIKRVTVPAMSGYGTPGYIESGGRPLNTYGGAVFAWGNLIIKNSTIKDNKADIGGGGVCQMDPDGDGATGLEIVNCIIIGNKTYTESPSRYGFVTGGGGVNSEGPLKIIDSKIGVDGAGNPAPNISMTYGGGVVTYSDATIENSIISRNVTQNQPGSELGVPDYFGSAVYMSNPATSTLKIDSLSQVLNRAGNPWSVKGAGTGVFPTAEVTYSQDTDIAGNVMVTLDVNVPIATPETGWTPYPDDGRNKTVFRKSYPASDSVEAVTLSGISTGTGGTAMSYIYLLDKAIDITGILPTAEFTKVFGESELDWKTSAESAVKSQLIQHVSEELVAAALYATAELAKPEAEAIVDKFTIDAQRAVGEDAGGYTITVDLATNIVNYILPSDKIAFASAFTIKKRPATVAVSSATVTWPANSASLSLTAIGGLRPGDYIATSQIAVSRDAAGTSTYDGSNVSLNIKDSNGIDITKNYDLTILPGQFTVNAAPFEGPTPGVGTPGTPTTDRTPAAGRTTTVNAGAVTTANAAAPDAGTTVESAPTPLVQTPKADVESSKDITENKTPLEATPESGWSLINLILVLLTAIMAIVSLIAIRNRSKKDELASGMAVGFGVINIAAVIAAAVVFILTEDLTLPMQVADDVTPWMVAIALLEVIITVSSVKGAAKTANENA